MVCLNSILTEAWNTSYQAQDKREKLQALSLAKECYSMKLELLTNATVVDDAIRFVNERTKSEAGKRKDECPTRPILVLQLQQEIRFFERLEIA